ncbi:nudC domain-containing protein 2-like [Juglans regia]|uniref:NudC domain-containing protein 2-like n=1 Tax=Juglans regia TaxID=51240 RepID=A0A6P9EDV6_JUGRE|nr:nudC domain-containing protein 2-like [Juglans regia]
MAEKLAPEKRHSFIHNPLSLCLFNLLKVFEWDQTLDEVNLYVNLPPDVHPKRLYCKIQWKHVEHQGQPFVTFVDVLELLGLMSQHELTCPVKTDSSFWTLGFLDILHITLDKRDKGQTWSSPILGQGQLDPYATDFEQKRLMLQRFQEEVLTSHKLSFLGPVLRSKDLHGWNTLWLTILV